MIDSWRTWVAVVVTLAMVALAVLCAWIVSTQMEQVAA